MHTYNKNKKKKTENVKNTEVFSTVSFCFSSFRISYFKKINSREMELHVCFTCNWTETKDVSTQIWLSLSSC